jgi:Domain of unknown function (DUF4352)
MHSQQPPGPGGPYGQQPPGPGGPYGQQPPGGSWEPPPPSGPYQPAPSGGWQPPPGGPYQQPPRKRRRRGLWITLGTAGGLIVLIIVAGALGGGNKSSPGTGAGATTNPSPANSQASQAAATTAVPGIGDKVRDGKFQFVVLRVSHRKSVGDTQFGLGETAQGVFTVISLKVTNIGSEPQTLDDSAQYVYDASGRKFSADSAADIDLSGANGQGSTWLNDINPGNTVTGKIAFDMPVGDKAVKIDLHDSIFSNGVTVRLS